jgi:hypothetical protein
MRRGDAGGVRARWANADGTTQSTLTPGGNLRISGRIRFAALFRAALLVCRSDLSSTEHLVTRPLSVVRQRTQMRLRGLHLIGEDVH